MYCKIAFPRRLQTFKLVGQTVPELLGQNSMFTDTHTHTDTDIMRGSISPNYLGQKNAIDYICKWCLLADLLVDQRAGLMLITSRKKYKLRNVYLSVKVLSYEDDIKYLGITITIDNKMNWADHFKIKARKAMSSLMQSKEPLEQSGDNLLQSCTGFIRQ